MDEPSHLVRKSSYEKIVNNIQILLNLDHKVDLRINVDHRNYENIPSLFQELYKNGFHRYEKFSPYLAYILDYGKYEAHMSAKELYDFFKNCNEIQKFNIGKDPLGLEKILISSIKEDKPFNFTSSYCGANKGAMLMFAPDGRIHACWDASPKDVKIGKYVPEISWNKEYYKQYWLNRTLSNLPVCNKCKYALFCGGGCQYLAEQKTGDSFSPYCNGFQELFNAIMVNVER